VHVKHACGTPTRSLDSASLGKAAKYTTLTIYCRIRQDCIVGCFEAHDRARHCSTALARSPHHLNACVSEHKLKAGFRESFLILPMRYPANHDPGSLEAERVAQNSPRPDPPVQAKLHNRVLLNQTATRPDIRDMSTLICFVGCPSGEHTPQHPRPTGSVSQV
jgi:hypothetical protein